MAEVVVAEAAPDPADDMALAETVGVALQVVLDRLTPRERVAFVLHDSFGFEFSTIAAILDTTPATARKLASRARAKVGQPPAEDQLADWEVVDAFMAAAREGDFDRLLRLLAPEAAVMADDAAILAGTPARIQGRHEVATFFNGSAQAALPVFVGDHPGAAWFQRGRPMVVFDFTILDGSVRRITFRAELEVLAQVARRTGEPTRLIQRVVTLTDRRSSDRRTRPTNRNPGRDTHEDDDLPPARGPLRPGPSRPERR